MGVPLLVVVSTGVVVSTCVVVSAGVVVNTGVVDDGSDGSTDVDGTVVVPSMEKYEQTS